MLNAYIKEITGAQMSEKEVVRLVQALANLGVTGDLGRVFGAGDNPVAFKAKFDVVMKHIQEARARRLEIQADLVASKYLELMERALEAKDFETALRALTQLCQRLRIFERHQALPLLETMEQASNDWEGMLRATIGVLAIAGKYDELLKALKLKAQLEQASNAEGMYEQALLSLEV